MATMASVKTVTATTYSPNHYDTTSVQTGLNSPNGPLWAYDNLHETFTAVPQGNGNWAVTIKVHRHLRRVREPDRGQPAEHNQGTVTGTIQYYVTSPNTPKAGLLPRQEPSVHQPGHGAEPVLRRQRDRHGRRHYTFTYSRRGRRGLHPDRLTPGTTRPGG